MHVLRFSDGDCESPKCNMLNIDSKYNRGAERDWHEAVQCSLNDQYTMFVFGMSKNMLEHHYRERPRLDVVRVYYG